MKHLFKVTKTTLLLSFGLSVLSNSIYAQNKNSPKANEIKDSSTLSQMQQLNPIEIKGIRVNDKSPFTVTNINEMTIKEKNLGQDIPYLLNQTPSVTITSDAGAGVGYTGIRIRGTDASRINFTINGIPINDAESQAAIFVDFPDLLSSTHSIQVQRGVGSSTNGTGAFGASVNIDNLNQSKKRFVEINNSFGSFKTVKNTVRIGSGLLKNGFQFDVRLSKISSDGYIQRSASDLKALQFIAGWTSKNKKSSFHFNLFTGKEKTGQAWNGVPEDSLAPNRRYNGLGLMEDGTYYQDQTDNYQQDYYQLFFDHKWNSNWNIHTGIFLTQGIGFYNEYQSNQSFLSYGLPAFISPSDDTFSTTNLTRRLYLDNNYYGLVYALNYHKKKTDFILGGAFTKYDGKHYGYVTWADYGVPLNYQWYHLTAFKNGLNIYAKLQQQLGLYWYVFADLQFRNVVYDINGFRTNPTLFVHSNYNFLNPKLGISYIKAHENNSESKAYLSFAVANKEPNRTDFEANTIDAPLPETLYDLELGYQYKKSNWNVSADLYFMSYKNQLILTGKINDVGAYTRTNIPESYRAGLELMGFIKPIPNVALNANATFSKNKIKNFTEFIDDYDNGFQLENSFENTDIAFSPNIISSGSITYEPFYGKLNQQHFFIDLTAKYVGRQYLDNTSNINRSINAYGLANLQFRYSVNLNFLKELSISLALNNIFDKKYAANGYTFSYQSGGQLNTENYYYPQAGFNFLLGLNLRF